MFATYIYLVDAGDKIVWPVLWWWLSYISLLGREGMYKTYHLASHIENVHLNSQYDKLSDFVQTT